MNKSIQPHIENLLSKVSYDSVSVGVVDFNTGKIDEINIVKLEDGSFRTIHGLYYDLASLTKVFTMGIAHLESDLDEKFYLLSEHRSSIPAWAILSRKTWEEDLLKFPMKPSETLYSDLGTIRFQLEFEKEYKKTLYESVKKNWSQELCYWLDFDYRENLYAKIGDVFHVHDPNAFNLGCFCAHAGLFGTVNGVGSSLLKLNKKFNLIKKIQSSIESLKDPDQRFVMAWDRKQNDNSFAGKKASENTFGHIGFTGTSLWIDPERAKGQIILSNAVKNHWYEKEELNQFRREIADILW
ncbi:serine hydrolase [Bacteriovoracaceae bacterium]|nr:serine hydrolase [Bacteriovoracaceae bacterium]